jgi:hypothetical protein
MGNDWLKPGVRVAVRTTVGSGIMTGWVGTLIRPAWWLWQSAWLVEWDGDSRPKRSRIAAIRLRPINDLDDEWTGRRPGLFS